MVPAPAIPPLEAVLPCVSAACVLMRAVRLAPPLDADEPGAALGMHRKWTEAMDEVFRTVCREENRECLPWPPRGG